MVKVPGTDEGAIAVRRLIAEGINVNITLLFAIEAHERVIEAYLAGLEDRVKAGGAIGGVASVASFFVSRVDTEVDKRLDALVTAGKCDTNHADMLRGKAAIANAKLAYRLFRERFAGPRWEALAAKGAQLQRPLWASTSTKNPAYRDVMYVEELIGPDTVDTMPPATIDAFRDHGETRRTVDANVDEAERVISPISPLGIPARERHRPAARGRTRSFQKSFDTLIAGLAAKAKLLGRTLAASRTACLRQAATCRRAVAHDQGPHQDRLHARSGVGRPGRAPVADRCRAGRRAHQLFARHARGARRARSPRSARSPRK